MRTSFCIQFELIWTNKSCKAHLEESVRSENKQADIVVWLNLFLRFIPSYRSLQISFQFVNVENEDAEILSSKLLTRSLPIRFHSLELHCWDGSMVISTFF